MLITYIFSLSFSSIRHSVNFSRNANMLCFLLCVPKKTFSNSKQRVQTGGIYNMAIAEWKLKRKWEIPSIFSYESALKISAEY